MPHRQLRLAGPPETIDPRVGELLLTGAREFSVPPDDHFRGNLGPSDVASIMADKNLTPEERARRVELLSAMSKICEWGDWSVENLETVANWIYRLDYEQARRRVQDEDKKKDELTKTPEAILWKSLRFILQTGLVAGLIAIVQFLVKLMTTQ